MVSSYMARTTPKRETRRDPGVSGSSGRDEAIKALIVKGLEAFEQSFRRRYPEASQQEVRDHMTRYLCERTRFEQQYPRRSFRHGRHR